MFRVERAYPGKWVVIDESDGEEMASVGKWMPGPMVHLRSQTIVSPAFARAIAEALVKCADEIDPD